MVSTPNDPKGATDFAWLVFRYGVIGGAATLVHALVLSGLVTLVELRPAFATVIGFLTAFGVSYLGHYYVTFRSRERHQHALPKYLAIAAAGAFLNWLIFVIVNEGFRMNYWMAFLIVVMVVPTCMFVMSRRIAFKK